MKSRFLPIPLYTYESLVSIQ